ncbi:aldehyde ferredoxin oxidoreductase family protein [Halalkalicoccus jeotgali]|uniref:Aldehyde ferredoxin oxidoreductase n=1 Tax=Halalkalicoccus jeotgali (strain DSM 18796 / CECT 7217 / JCM 14584 / KCTC 4019 / B3) TaxID=795797 RepID=D8J9A8_HALJB|nr:aldehyde ferredoxin oxidoreductase C-terminal domain-containing protein [Halalkalicoccus jeotgali]ADJ16377.1 aldehyde ferredoxin oxidoreductase [Halalkalicoccus jeotgali B3]ELY37111.1 aldehyde ferredoxin oxidoreductase [Halalkalicoccus jeotgali B3]
MARLSHLLRVDLGAETASREPIPERWLDRYVGGKGLGARYLFEELDPGTDPMGSDNALLFIVGPLTGRTPGEPRYAAITKSPLTGAFLDSYSGGEFAGALAGALGDCLGVLVTGRADEPMALTIEDGEATLEPTDAWGADAAATAGAFDGRVACIGPAGENRVSYATIAADGGDHHAGRGGAGAVMGAKRLKAVVARGQRPTEDSDLREIYEERFVDDETGRWQAASETLESVDFADAVGALATRGWQENRFDGIEGIGIEAARGAATGRESEGAIPGGFTVPTPDGESVPRGATQMTLGAGLGIDEFDAVAALGAQCDRFGIDVISAGSAVAWAIRASEAGLIERDLAFGDRDAARELLAEIATRTTPLGEALADGVERASATFGGEDFVPAIKGMELPAYDPRGARSMALAYATSDRGGCHRRARPIEDEPFSHWSDDERVERVIAEQNRRSVLWSLIVDDFVGDSFADLGAAWLSELGYDLSPADLATLGERVWTLTRLFNVREGLDREADRVPAPLTESAADGESIDPEEFEGLLDRYYAARGWDERGRPILRTLERLELASLDGGDGA